MDDFTCVHSKNALLTHILSTSFSITSVLFSCKPFGTILMSLLYNNNVNTITVKKNNVNLICLLQSNLNPDWYTSSFYPLVSKINSGLAVALNGIWSVQPGSDIRQPDEDGQPHQPDEDGQPDMDSLMNMDSWCSCVAVWMQLCGLSRISSWSASAGAMNTGLAKTYLTHRVSVIMSA